MKNQKRIICVIMTCILVMGMCACDVVKQQNVTNQSTEGTNEITQDVLNTLVKENLNCMYNIFVLGSLPKQGKPVKGEWIYQVSEEYFKSYADFEKYVRSVYCKETADMYLYNYPYEGEPKYVNIDGKLCENLMYDGGKGYYVDWTNYKITIDSSSENECQFTVHCKVEMPAEKPVAEDYPVKGKAVFEDGKWVLTSMLS